MKTTILLLFCLFSGFLSVSGQSPAALEKLKVLYTADQITDMQTHDPGKYNSLVWYLASSWKVVEGASVRPATEAEILAVNIKAYDNERKVDEKITVADAATGLSLQLLSAEDCWTELTTVLSPADWKKMHDYYLFNKSLREQNELPKGAN